MMRLIPRLGLLIANKLRVKGNLLMRVTCNLIEKLPSWGQSVRRLAYWRSPVCNPAYYNHGFRGQRAITEPWLTRGPGDTGRGLLGGGAPTLWILIALRDLKFEWSRPEELSEVFFYLRTSRPIRPSTASLINRVMKSSEDKNKLMHFPVFCSKFLSQQ